MPSARAPHIVHIASVTSTMNELDRLAAAGAPAWTVVLADEQTHGRGRLDRTWHAPRGSALLSSTLIRLAIPPERVGLVAIAAGVALAHTLEDLGVRPALKWPNDVLMEGRKVAGILARSRLMGPEVVINLGMGVNLTAVPAGLESSATCLAHHMPEPPDARQLLAGFLPRLDRWFSEMDSANLRGAWERRAAFLGERVTVDEGAAIRKGNLVGLGPSGELVLDDGDGDRILIVAGELTRGPNPVGADQPPIL